LQRASTFTAIETENARKARADITKVDTVDGALGTHRMNAMQRARIEFNARGAIIRNCFERLSIAMENRARCIRERRAFADASL
jgi:hypothetical protein